jgi:hypothetical protein
MADEHLRKYEDVQRPEESEPGGSGVSPPGTRHPCSVGELY